MFTKLKIWIFIQALKSAGIKLTIDKDYDGLEIVVLTMSQPKDDYQKNMQQNILRQNEKKVKRICDTESGKLRVVFNAPVNRDSTVLDVFA